MPFFGSGFTKGSKAKKGKVPDANGLAKIITETAAANPSLDLSQATQIKSITALKSAFGLLEREEYISSKSAQTLLTNTFSEVDLATKEKRDILSLDWPHIFTFNIDDAIERQNRSLKVLQPNKRTSREYISAHSCLFKIHGDITECSSYEDINLIFTWRHYANSIASNKAMLGFLSDESKNSSFLFIGCSLDAELDLIHLSKETPLNKSIFIKKGKVTIEEEIALGSYGISRVIYFDDYDEIYKWIFSVLKDIRREPVTREIFFDESPLARDEAKLLISNGGPLYKLTDQKRIARASSTFASRDLIEEFGKKIRRVECVLLTGRRFSGKTLFLFQAMLSLKEYSTKFFGSSDPYNPTIKRQLQSLDNHLFVFDSNHLDPDSLDDVLRAKISPTSKLILCASNGDAERVRFRLSDKGFEFEEIKLRYSLSKHEENKFNDQLAASGLPLTNSNESLVDYAFRCHEEYKSTLPKSTLFERKFKDETYLILLMIAAFGKAKKSQIDCILDSFDLGKFVETNDRVFDIETSATGEIILVCSASAWLVKVIQNFVQSTTSAHSSVSRLIRLLENGGFSGLAKELIRVDKINEISGGHKSRVFIKRIYEDIADLYNRESHYWLQRAKAELISAQKREELLEGIGHAQKVRLDNSVEKGQTYYSATLVLAQLYAKMYKLTKDTSPLVNFVAPCIESIDNYQNNKRHVDGMSNIGDVLSVVEALRKNPPHELLPSRDRVKQICDFFEDYPGTAPASRRRPTRSHTRKKHQ